MSSSSLWHEKQATNPPSTPRLFKRLQTVTPVCRAASALTQHTCLLVRAFAHLVSRSRDVCGILVDLCGHDSQFPVFEPVLFLVTGTCVWWTRSGCTRQRRNTSSDGRRTDSTAALLFIPPLLPAARKKLECKYTLNGPLVVLPIFVANGKPVLFCSLHPLQGCISADRASCQYAG